MNKTWQEARSQHPLPSLCFSSRSEKQRWPPWSLIGWDNFDFSSETTEGNSTKLGRKQDLNILYQVCVFGRSEKQDGCPCLWLAETFWACPLKRLNGIQQYLTGSQIATSSTNFVFFGPIGKKDDCPGRFLIKVTHCTQVHDMGPFGPLVHFSHATERKRTRLNDPKKMLLSWRSNLHLEESGNRQEQPPVNPQHVLVNRSRSLLHLQKYEQSVLLWLCSAIKPLYCNIYIF